jgi:hypothetical protein
MAKNLLLRGIPDGMHRLVKLVAENKKTTMSKVIVSSLAAVRLNLVEESKPKKKKTA